MYGLGEPVGRKFLSGTSVLGFFHEASAYGGKLHPKPDGVKEASDLLIVSTCGAPADRQVAQFWQAVPIDS
jgi:hypothetical protein